jgi:hypothetical protein
MGSQALVEAAALSRVGMLMPDAGLECDLFAVEDCRDSNSGDLIRKCGNESALIRGGAIVPVAWSAGPPELEAGPAASGVGFKPVVSSPLYVPCITVTERPSRLIEFTCVILVKAVVAGERNSS